MRSHPRTKRWLAFTAGVFAAVAGLPAPAQAATIPVTFTVDNVRDSGPGSLRQAIADANAGPVATSPADRPQIVFTILAAGTQVIRPASNLPAIAVPVVIDGYTQPGAAPATSTRPAVLRIVIDAVNTTRGLRLDGSGSTVSGLVIRSAAATLIGKPCASDGICVTGDRNIITGNYIGTGPDGMVAYPNLGDGIDIQGYDNIVGLPGPAGRNVISGNGLEGVRVAGGANHVQNNFVGLNAAGGGTLGNGANGIDVAGDHNTVGLAGAGNAVANNLTGVSVGGDHNTVRANFVGTGGAGAVAHGNGTGIDVSGAGNEIGGTGAGEGNLVSGNTMDGIDLDATSSDTVVHGNKVGTDHAGTAALANLAGGIKVMGTGNVVDGANLISGNAGNGVEVAETSTSPTSGTRVEDNRIGTTADGLTALANGTGTGGTGNDNGVVVSTFTTGNRIAGNVISGNIGDGVHLFGAGGVIEDNLIGFGADGATGVSNQSDGIEVVRGTGNAINGNVISANRGNGVLINGSGNTLTANTIGVDLTHDEWAGNDGSGVVITGGSGNLIGTTDATVAPNTIAHNRHDGVAVTNGAGNPILHNSIYGNGINPALDLDIDLDADGILGNDALDADTGPDDLQNHPIIDTGTTTTDVSYYLEAERGVTYRIEFYAGTCAPGGTGGGETFLGAVQVTTSATLGEAYGSQPFDTPATAGQDITATATSVPAAPLTGSTSEFSACFRV